MFDMEFISTLLQNLLLALLVPLFGLAARLLIDWANAKRAELTAAQNKNLNLVIRMAIMAAQQLYNAGDGASKKRYALDVAESWLTKQGLNIDLDVLSAAIEATVYDEFHRFDEPKPVE